MQIVCVTMSETNSTSTNAADVDESNPLEQSTITMLDVLEEEKELEEEYAAVLGGSDEKDCTYAKGAIQRQALYSCLTCCPEARENPRKSAGVCLACSYKCHENHELIELYTRRNFRCDCPTLEKRCALNPQLEAAQPKNANNLYNQNFQGVYCKCKRPYPDPERTTEETMLQCVICEDWFHLQHMKAPAGSEKLSNACSEMICDCCMERHDFLRDYIGLALQPSTETKESATEVNVVDSKLNKNDAQPGQSEQPPEKRNKLNEDECQRPKSLMGNKGKSPRS